MQEEEVVPVEKAKKISQETIKHLAQHTDLIQDVDEDGTITPSKVLNVNKKKVSICMKIDLLFLFLII